MPGEDFEIKTLISLDGVEDYTKKIKEINSSTNLLKSEIRLLNAEYSKNANGVKALTAKKASFGKMVEMNRDKVKAQELEIEKLKKQYGEGSVQVNNATAKLNGYKVALMNSEQELKKVSAELNKAKFGFSNFGDFAQKAGAALKTGIVAGAKAGAQAIKSIATVGAAVATTLTGLAISSGKFADDLLTNSSKTRQSTDDLQKYSYALNFIDGDMGSLTGAMKKNIMSMQQSTQGNKNLQKAYKQLGVNVKDSKGNIKDSTAVFWESIDALGKIENETQRDALAMQLFGKSATELNPIIAAGSKAFMEMGDEAEKMGLVMSKEALSKLGAFDDQMQKLKFAGGALKNTLGLVALPFVEQLSSGGLEIITNFNKALMDSDGSAQGMQAVITSLIGDMSNFIADKAPMIIELGMTIINGLATGITQNSPTIMAALMQIIKSLTTLFTQNLPILIDTFAQVTGLLATALVENLPLIVEGIFKIMGALLKAIWDSKGKIWEAMKTLAKGLFKALIGGLVSIGKPIYNWLKGSITGVKSKIANLGQGIGNLFNTGFGKTLKTLGSNVLQMGKTVSANYLNIFNNIVGLVKGNISLSQAWESILGSVKNIFTSFIDTAKNCWKTIISAISSAIFGDDRLVKAWEGISTTLSTAWTSFKTTAKTAWNNVVGAVKGVISGDITIKEAWESIGTTLSTAWTSFKTTAQTAWNSILSTVSAIPIGDTTIGQAWENISKSITTKWDSFKTAAYMKWLGIKSAISGIAIGDTTIGAAWEGICTAVKQTWENLKTKASEIWTGILNAITAPFVGFKEWFQGLFKVPASSVHVSDSGITHGGKGRTISWKAKGAVFTKPTIFPHANIGVGEAGAEAVLPITKLWQQLDKRFKQPKTTNKPAQNIYITQHIHAQNTSYYDQQKQAMRQAKMAIRGI